MNNKKDFTYKLMKDLTYKLMKVFAVDWACSVTTSYSLGILSGVCGSCDPVHPLFGAILREMFKIVYPPIPSHYKPEPIF